MRTIARGLFVLLFVLGLVRAALYGVYVACRISNRFEVGHLESVMVLFAWRARHGLSLYPDWVQYPHVANFYAPLYFLIVGAIGRVLGTDFQGLYLIGRVVTVGAILSATGVLGFVVRRRYGISAALFGMVLSLGAGPLYGAGLMTRPDALAELFGLTGFFLAGARRSLPALCGGIFLYLAVMTKQTALVYLLAAVLGLSLEARGRRALLLGAVVSAALLATVTAVRIMVEPNFVRCLLGEARTPADLASWWQTTRSIASIDPEFFVLTVAGIVIWSKPPRRDPLWIMLASLLLAAGLVTAAKRGSAENYFLGVRSVAALAAGALWHDLSSPGPRPKVWQLLAAAATAAGLGFSVRSAEIHTSFARLDARIMATVEGEAADQFYQLLYRTADDPSRHLLTDVGCIDVRQGERAVFGDPYRFKVMVENGQIDPRELRRRLDEQFYELIVTRKDLFAADYAAYEFGLPATLVERARPRYALVGVRYDLFFYSRRGDARNRDEGALPALPSR